MSDTTTALIVLGSLGIPGLILIIVSRSIFAKESKLKKRCTAAVKGTVIRYVFAGKAPAPVVEYEVGGTKYEKVRAYRSLVTTNKVYRGGKGFLDPDYELSVDESNVLHISRGPNYRLDLNTVGDQLWPVGAEIPVYYDPQNPKTAFVDVLPQKRDFIASVFLWVGVLFIALAVLFGALLGSGVI